MKVRLSTYMGFDDLTHFHIGSYLGDVWYFDFSTLNFTEVKLEGEDKALLSRSNHTAVFYKPHNS
jgi:hypothetical protein